MYRNQSRWGKSHTNWSPWVTLALIAGLVMLLSNGFSFWMLMLVVFVIVPALKNTLYNPHDNRRPESREWGWGWSCEADDDLKRKNDDKRKHDEETERLYFHVRDGERYEIIDADQKKS